MPTKKPTDDAPTKAPKKAAKKAPKKAESKVAAAAEPAVSDAPAPKKPASKKAVAKKPIAKEARAVAMAIAEAGLDKKALEVVVIDVTGKVDYADFVVVMSGRSDRQVSAICKGVEQDLREQHGVKCIAVEGMPQSKWALMDFGDVIVHVFHDEVRGYYDLETLWMDAARTAVVPKAPARS